MRSIVFNPGYWVPKNVDKYRNTLTVNKYAKSQQQAIKTISNQSPQQNGDWNYISTFIPHVYGYMSWGLPVIYLLFIKTLALIFRVSLNGLIKWLCNSFCVHYLVRV